ERECRGSGAAACRERAYFGACQHPVEETLYIENRLVSMRAILRRRLFVVFFHHLVPDLSAERARTGREAERSAGGPAVVAGRIRVASRRLDLTVAEPKAGQHATNPLRPGRGGICGGCRLTRGFHFPQESLSCGRRDRPGQFLQRTHDAWGPARVHGCGGPAP